MSLFCRIHTSIGTIDEFIMRNQTTWVVNQDNKHHSEEAEMPGVGEASKRSRIKSKSTCKYGLVRRYREPSRLQCKKIIKMFKKSKSSRKYIERIILRKDTIVLKMLCLFLKL